MIPHVVTNTQCSEINEQTNKYKTPSYRIVSSETFVIMALYISKFSIRGNKIEY